MKKPNAIIVGGTGQFGITLSNHLLKKKIWLQSQQGHY